MLQQTKVEVVDLCFRNVLTPTVIGSCMLSFNGL